MRRRGLLGLIAAAPAAAQGEFPARMEAAGRGLVLNGTGSRLYSVFAVEVYRAALYLEAPSRDATAILASQGPKLILARYRRDVPLRGVLAAWEASFEAICGCPLPDAFRDWLAPLPAGAEERYLFLPDAVQLEATGRPGGRRDGPDPAARLDRAACADRSPAAGVAGPHAIGATRLCGFRRQRCRQGSASAFQPATWPRWPS